jgi:adenylate cyclase
MTAMSEPAVVQLGSVLFTDLVGFTEYTDAAGDAAALRVLDAQTSLVSSILDCEPDSRVVKELGDGLMVWLAHPVTAVDVACRLLDGFRQAQSDDRIPLAVRMGMHFGEAIVRGADFIGQTVNIASRVSDLAGPGELLVSEGVVAAVRDSLVSRSFEPVGPTQVKGVQAPVWLYRVAG